MDTLLNASATAAVRGLHRFGLSGAASDLDRYLDVFRTSTADGGDQFRILQPIWDWRLGWEPFVASPLFPIITSNTLLFACLVPWMLIDLFGSEWKWIQRYKIQPDKPVTWAAMRKAMTLTMWNNLLYILPVSVAQWVWTPDTVLPETAPELWSFIWQQYAALAVFDFEYYVWHYLHHKIRFLYKHVHGVHHQYHATSVWVTQYLHPYELITIGLFTVTAPWYFNAHFMTHISFQFCAILVSVEGHIGYDLPFMPHHWAPFWGGSVKHDMHHQKPLSNYQPFFNWFDRLFNTECPGQLAGGYKPQPLIDWEKRYKEEVHKRMDDREERLKRMKVQENIEKRQRRWKRELESR